MNVLLRVAILLAFAFAAPRAPASRAPVVTVDFLVRWLQY
eukprot:COSAG03_NODE_15630_length_425_cov_0.634969_1_plen_39_part_10